MHVHVLLDTCTCTIKYMYMQHNSIVKHMYTPCTITTLLHAYLILTRDPSVIIHLPPFFLYYSIIQKGGGGGVLSRNL